MGGGGGGFRCITEFSSAEVEAVTISESVIMQNFS